MPNKPSAVVSAGLAPRALTTSRSVFEWRTRPASACGKVAATGLAATVGRSAQASAALSQFQAPGRDLEAVTTTLLRAEALGSSFIEGLRASNKRLALAAYDPVVRRSDSTCRAS